tara:strand:- start:3639 stop:3869 length:231 start_codon:yes stop_codon:yes gene_type:complete
MPKDLQIFNPWQESLRFFSSEGTQLLSLVERNNRDLWQKIQPQWVAWSPPALVGLSEMTCDCLEWNKLPQLHLLSY